ncbi:hypothetical protein PSAC2689_40148 [Paraburkholderia sacchari]
MRKRRKGDRWRMRSSRIAFSWLSPVLSELALYGLLRFRIAPQAYTQVSYVFNFYAPRTFLNLEDC